MVLFLSSQGYIRKFRLFSVILNLIINFASEKVEKLTSVLLMSLWFSAIGKITTIKQILGLDFQYRVTTFSHYPLINHSPMYRFVKTPLSVIGPFIKKLYFYLVYCRVKIIN